MRTIHAITAAGALGLLAAFTFPAAAQMAHDHGHAAAPAGHMAGAGGEGEVRKIDVANRKVTLRHEASKDMGMPAMTMVYPVADASLLAKVKVGDKVRFRAAGGGTTITDLQAVR